MWGALLVLALLTTINPVRIALILLVLSRPRPMQNLLAYWLGAMLVGLVTLVIPLMALYATPKSASFAEAFADPTANPAAQRTAVAIGVLLIAIAAVMVVRSSVRQRMPVGAGRHAAGGADGDTATPTLVADSDVPPVITRLLHHTHDADADGASTAPGLLTRARNAWQNGSPWISFLIGVVVLPPLDGVVFALAVIVASGAGIGLQMVAVLAYMVGVLAIEEIILVSNLVAPERTHAVLRRLHDWARAHRRKFVAAILAVVGISLVLRGMGGL